ncbi:hypothetical protein [Aequorivita sp. CIP111184]|uniref:hypothetical protein n=1 Tax=Aequorivita sp. CIP111184 TaxID=2211356 RepID=UPI000DBC4483|nr:hypothetical protein [Aequorivita sp. CIP111184]SRX56208.1 hypothetical protein AEQU1_03238 [Aequorivita sp. CIP111184]
MANQKGFIKLRGSLGGLTFYENKGKDVVRTTGGVEKDRILKEPAFKRTRENMSEFGASAIVGKALRMGFANIIKSMAGNYIVGRITGLMKRINSVGPGIRGQREFEILNNKSLLEGFEFNKKAPLDSIFYATSDPPSLDANRSVATWLVPDFNTSNYINPPEGATHFRLVLAVTVLSDYAYANAIKGYEPVAPDENETNGIAFSAEIPIGGMVGSDTTLSVDLGFAAALPLTVGVVTAVGIIFYQEINTAFYELASDNALKIVLVG